MDISIPKEYESLSILQRQIGDIKTIKYFCYLWNHYNNADTLRYKGDDGFGEILITGKCANLEELWNLYTWLNMPTQKPVKEDKLQKEINEIIAIKNDGLARGNKGQVEAANAEIERLLNQKWRGRK